eukprot:194754-Chlamydomonas_euryale.AAC.1
MARERCSDGDGTGFRGEAVNQGAAWQQPRRFVVAVTRPCDSGSACSLTYSVLFGQLFFRRGKERDRKILEMERD